MKALVLISLFFIFSGAVWFASNWSEPSPDPVTESLNDSKELTVSQSLQTKKKRKNNSTIRSIENDTHTIEVDEDHQSEQENWSDPQYIKDDIEQIRPDPSILQEILTEALEMEPNSQTNTDSASTRDVAKTPLVDSSPSQATNSTSDLLFGGVSVGPKPTSLIEDLQSLDEDQDDQQETDQELDALPWVEGQARGYTLLALSQPEARTAMNVQLNNMLKSRVRDLYLGVLIDGTFGWDPEYLKQVIQVLNRDDRNLTLALYLTNGATMREHDTTEISAGFNTIPPVLFRDLIQYDTGIRETFQDLCLRALSLFALNKQLNAKNRNIAYVMLEDNLDRSSYLAMRSLAVEVLGGVAEVGRNPCFECFRGNDTFVGDEPLEVHQLDELTLLRPGDGISLDGLGYYFSFDQDRRGIDQKTVELLLDAALEAKLEYVGLWRFDRQGLHGGERIVPEERDYTVATKRHLEEERELLRYGLEEEAN